MPQLPSHLPSLRPLPSLPSLPPGSPLASPQARAWAHLGAAGRASLLGLAALLLWDASGLDLAVVRLFGNAGGFAWREHWLTAGVLHQGGRWLATGLVLALLLNLWRPLWAGPSLRERGIALASTALALLVIPLIKRGSATSCPWDLAEFGGQAQPVSHWAWGLLDGGPGHCFPSGHASAAFAFFSLFFLLRHHQPRLARRALGAVLVMGALYGLAQLARGAHYPSHTLWTGWICWTLAAGVARLGTRR